MRLFSKSVVVTLMLLSSTLGASAKGMGTEWSILNQEVMELYHTDRYDRAVVATKKALEVAKKNVGPDHPDVAAILNNLAALYRATKRDAQALEMEKRAERIRVIKR